MTRPEETAEDDDRGNGSGSGSGFNPVTSPTSPNDRRLFSLTTATTTENNAKIVRPSTTTTTTAATTSSLLSKSSSSITSHMERDSVMDGSSSNHTTTRHHNSSSRSLTSHHQQDHHDREAPQLQALTSSRQLRQTAKINESLTANKLRFDRLKDTLYGRQDEIRKLNEVLELHMEQQKKKKHEESHSSPITCSRQLILIGGEAGTGKSSLALQLKRPTTFCERGIFCSGKYDLSSTTNESKPLEGLIQASNELCDSAVTILSKAPSAIKPETSGSSTLDSSSSSGIETLDDLRALLVESMGYEMIRVLQNVVLQFRCLVPLDNDSSDEDEDESTSSDSDFGTVLSFRDKDILSSAFQRFFRTMSKAFHPLVCVIDDLQWADAPSLDIISGILTDTDNSMVIVGCYRSNECPKEHVLSKTIRNLKEGARIDSGHSQNAASSVLVIDEIEIGNLSTRNVTEMLMELLSKDRTDDIEQLAEICVARTEGNVFFVRAFLSMLVDEGYLTFTLGTFSWNWDLATILNETSASPNLVDLIQRKLRRLDVDVLEILKIASCLGHTIDRDILCLAWNQIASSASDGADFGELLKTSVDQNYLVVTAQVASKGNEKTSSIVSLHDKRPSALLKEVSLSLRFIHDNVQESVISLMSVEERQLLQYKLGKVLLASLSRHDLDEMMFVLTGLLNQSTSNTSPDLEIAKLNLRSARRANGIAAFASVVAFVDNALRRLPDTMWSSNFEMTLQLHSLGARAAYCLGHCDQALEHCNAVIHQKRASPLQKCTAYKVQVDIIQMRGDMKQSLNLALRYLDNLGCSFPSNKVITRLKAKRDAKDTKKKCIPTIASLTDMRMMSDPVAIEIVQLLERAGSAAYLDQQLDAYVMIRCKTVKCMHDFGFLEEAPGYFASFAIVSMHITDDIQSTKEIVDVALAILDKLPSDGSRCRAMMSLTIYFFGYTQPIQVVAKRLVETYQLGLKVGNTFTATSSIMWYCYAQFWSGSSLYVLMDDLSIYVPQMKRLGHKFMALCTSFIWELAVSLVGIDNGVVHPGMGKIGENDLINRAKDDMPGVVQRAQVWNKVYFGQYEEAGIQALEVGGFDHIETQYVGGCFGMDYLLFGVAMYAMARKTGHAKYKRQAHRAKSKVENFVKNGCVNFVHVLSILHGEFYALTGKTEKAKESYSRAVVEAARAGFINNAALASDRFGDYLVEVNELDQARDRYRASIQFFRDWGALRVASRLEKKHESLLST